MSVIDISPSERRLKELEQENRLYKIILDYISEGVQISDSNEIMVYYNKACEQMENVSREECVGKSVYELYATTGNTQENTIHRNVLKTGVPVVNSCTQYMTNGRIVDIISSTYPFNIGNELTGVFSVIRDASQTRKYLHEIFSLKKYIHNEAKYKEQVKLHYTFDKIVHSSKIMRDTITTAKKVAANNSNVLIYGETGTGKELFAQSIHSASIFFEGPFIAINCAAIPEALLESLIFGTEKGAFTGAVDKIGLFEQAENGTLFLDEINTMSLMLQSKLLRAIQERAFRRIGGKTTRKVFCRIISAVNKDPLVEIANSNLRKDLYYRIAAVTVFIPPLQQREDDILLLANHFVDKFNKIFSSKIKKIDENVEGFFEKYNWPGNVRELEHVIESCMNMVNIGDEVLKKDHFPAYLYDKFFWGGGIDNPPLTIDAEYAAVGYGEGFLKKQLEEAEKRIIKHCLDKNKGNITQAARELGLHRQALQYRIKKMNIRE